MCLYICSKQTRPSAARSFPLLPQRGCIYGPSVLHANLFEGGRWIDAGVTVWDVGCGWRKAVMALEVSFTWGGKLEYD